MLLKKLIAVINILLLGKLKKYTFHKGHHCFAEIIKSNSVVDCDLYGFIVDVKYEYNGKVVKCRNLKSIWDPSNPEDFYVGKKIEIWSLPSFPLVTYLENHFLLCSWYEHNIIGEMKKAFKKQFLKKNLNE